MVTSSKREQNVATTMKVNLPEQAEPIVDVLIVHDEGIGDKASTFVSKTEQYISREPSPEADYEYQNVLLQSKIVQLAARVAHESNSPLSAILVYAQLLLARGNLDESSRECLQNIYREAQRAEEISTELLSFARRGKPEKSLISIQEVIQKSVELLIHSLRQRNIEVAVKLQPDIPKTTADPHQLQKVFNSIIANAEQAMAEAHGKGRLSIKAQAVGEMIRIIFDDNGPGIKAKDIKNIFDPFFSTKESGLGLSLTISCAIVEAHGGNIRAMNRPGLGATFVVELPVIA